MSKHSTIYIYKKKYHSDLYDFITSIFNIKMNIKKNLKLVLFKVKSYQITIK